MSKAIPEGPAHVHDDESLLSKYMEGRGVQHRSFGRQLLLSLEYLFTSEVHAFAFSIAANALLAFFPFMLILLTLCGRWLRWRAAYEVILQLLRANLPTGANFVIRNLVVLVHGRSRLQVVSIVMLLFTSSGMFLPLEVALNKVWGIQKNRHFLRNQVISFFLAFASGVLTLLSILVTATFQQLAVSRFGRMPPPGVISAISRGILEVVSVPLVVSIYVLIYYILPNGKIPLYRVAGAAIVAGLLTVGAKFVYSMTLPLFRFREVYGPFALSVTLLFWAFVGALILLFGARLAALQAEDEISSRVLKGKGRAQAEIQ